MTTSSVIRVVNRHVAANTYLVTGAPGTCVLVDPGLDADAIQAALEEHDLTPTAIYCTHGHFDHLGSAERFRLQYEVPVYLHAADANVAGRSNLMMMAMELPVRIVVPQVISYFDARGAQSSNQEFQVVHAPGHTAGSVVLRFGTWAFTGDMVYRDDLFRTGWPEADELRHTQSLRDLWARLPDDTIIYPGHGGSATFGSIKRRNLALRSAVGVNDSITT